MDLEHVKLIVLMEIVWGWIFIQIIFIHHHIFKQIGMALHAGESVGLLHGDVKPSNIFLGPNGHITLIDWGLSEYGPYSSLEPSICCTPEYASPEQIFGKEIDVRSDLYSLGVVMYEAMAGNPPFEGATYIEIFEKACSTLPDYDPIPRPIRPLVERCLKRNPVDRYSSVHTFLREVEALALFIPNLRSLWEDRLVYSRNPPIPSIEWESFDKQDLSSEGWGADHGNHVSGIEAGKWEEFSSADKRFQERNPAVANK